MSAVIRILDHRLQPPAGAQAALLPLLPAHDRMLRLPELVERSGLSRATLYRRIAQGQFPALQSLGGQAKGLRESSFLTWLASIGEGGAQ